MTAVVAYSTPAVLIYHATPFLRQSKSISQLQAATQPTIEAACCLVFGWRVLPPSRRVARKTLPYPATQHAIVRVCCRTLLAIAFISALFTWMANPHS